MVSDSRIAQKVVEYASLPFYIKDGPRKEKIIEDVKYNFDMEPEMIVDGSVCYKKGEGRPVTLVSSHMDTVFGLKPSRNHAEIIEYDGTKKIRGTLDNAAGVVINREIIGSVKPKKGTLWSIFSVEEEDYPGSVSKYGVERVCEEFESMGISPDLGIALDVTKSESPSKDESEVYAENFSSRLLAESVRKFVSENNIPYVNVREKKFKDEAYVFGKRHAAFAFGPGVYGNMHRISTVNVDSLKAGTDFLESVIESPEFIEAVSAEDKRTRKK